MNSGITAALAACLAICGVSAASAEVIDFESLAFDGPTNDGPRGLASPLVFGAYTLTATDPFGLPPILVYSRQSTNNPDFGGASILPNRPATGITLTRTDGGAFDFRSIDLTFAYDDQNAFFPGDTATYSFSDGTSQSIAFDNLAGFQTFTFNKSGLTSLNISSASAYAIDNISVSAAAVPEPAAWAMLVGGFGVVGGAVRRRRTGAPASPCIA